MSHSRRVPALLFVLLALVPVQVACAESTIISEGLALAPLGTRGRMPFVIDPLQHGIVVGTGVTPKAGDTVAWNDRESEWTPVTAAENGWFEDKALEGGYLYVPVTSEQPRIVLLRARRHSLVYVNGELRGGDPYETGFVATPVQLRKGRNDFLFRVQRGRLRVEIVEREGLAEIGGDATLPDLLPGVANPWGAIVLRNTSRRPLETSLLASLDGGDPQLTRLRPLASLEVRKVPFRIPRLKDQSAGSHDLLLRLFIEKELADTKRISVRVPEPNSTYRVTFRSAIDGSVQYYAVQPASRSDGPKALVLSLHGAGVQAIGQARAYSSKTWAHIVAPTNRRPYGFDWEDWGRLDALEVLQRCQQHLSVDPARRYLTGHSMGGHGTWQLGVLFPDRFAAIGPSAGWVSFQSYGGATGHGDGSVEQILARATVASDTISLCSNLKRRGVYILHGDADTNVPVTEARTMRAELEPIHEHLAYHEQPGAGHWWDSSDEPGADCVDWQPMFDMFAQRRLPSRDEVREVEFRTPNPQITHRSHWLSIDRQLHSNQISSAHVRFDPGRNRFRGDTVNVAHLTLDVSHISPERGALSIVLDGDSLGPFPAPVDKRLRLQRLADSWQHSPALDPKLKGPHRAGPFKQAFQNNALLVIGDQGTPEETAWALAKVRYDSETFWYRGNGRFQTILASQFESDEHPDRNIIIYGHAEMNSAWSAVFEDCPIKVRRGVALIGKREFGGPGLGCLFTYPRKGHDRALVAVVCGTGSAGMRATDRMPYFVSGIGYPDFILFGAEVLLRGSEGVRAAGYFGPDWKLASGDSCYR